ncbi:putative oxygenase [Streptomyces longisporoflavus]|uniref:FAD-dependent monooxygenase n=1 Tax=Streptomyces longisporoflavus TaxID=28044 RepID=UPI00167E4E99|nr:FAD-dependent monooxygenase [Streptomyces longisporoflavus]GGV66912.1 putative oxygenase [Streptomyces longisporoflavus]
MTCVRTDVVIVGGGPVGLLLAAELAGYGVRTVVLEERAEVAERPRATTLHARTAQVLARRGYLPAPELPLRAGVNRARFHFAGVWGLELTAPAAEPDPLFKRPQADLERLFEERALAAGVRVLRRHRMTGLDHRESAVTVSAEHPGGRAEFEAAYVVGADGARSTVRTLGGIPSDTTPPTVAAMVGVVRCDGAEAPEPGWHQTPLGWVVAKRTAEGRLHLRVADCLNAPADHRLPLELDEFRRETSRIMGRDIDMDEPRWLSRFSDFSRLARTYRSGRVFLVGDAAHLHFPVGAQGLSTGLLDALNLGWKLAFTVRGAAAPGLLDSYDAERRPAAERLLDQVRTQTDLMRPGRTPGSLEELAAAGGAADAGAELERLGLMVSGQDTVLPPRTGQPSAWEGQFFGNRELVTDDGTTDVIRLLRDGRMLLVRFGSAETGRAFGVPHDLRHDLRHVLRVVRAEPAAGMPGAALLLRPDGYVAWASDVAGDLDAPVLEWLAPGRADQALASASSAASWSA